jgi:hypothetical protein
MTVRVIKKRPEPTKRKTVLLIKIESGSAFLHMLLICILRYLKSILRYTFLIWIHITWTHNIYVSKDVKIRVIFRRQTGVCEQKVWEAPLLPSSQSGFIKRTNKCGPRISGVTPVSYS